MHMKYIYIALLAAALGLAACSRTGAKADSGASIPDTEKAVPDLESTTDSQAGLQSALTDTTALPADSSAVAAAAVGTPLIVDFSATWCPPCQKLKPLFAELARQYGGKATFRTIDIDENPELAERFRVDAVPTIMVFPNDKMEKPIETIVGYDPDRLKATVAKYTK